MQQQITLAILPAELQNETIVIQHIADSCGVQAYDITGYHVIKKSIDARGKQVKIILTVQVFIHEPFIKSTRRLIHFKDVTASRHKVIIVGAGPAGLFAALKLIEHGIQPVVLERGKDVRLRRRDLALLNKEGIINADSNYCFGEGGAGTYSDGKLYTRSNKRGNINRILNLFVQFGADEKILYEAHPHIGTNKLPQIITNMRQQIVECGGVLLFEEKVTDLVIQNNSITGVKTTGGNLYEANAVILATGHSARDIFQLLHNKNIAIEFKPFALGVRIEHPQELIDGIQYHAVNRGEFLPPASYSLVEQINGRSVFSFCMCPGGIIAPAATEPGQLVVNGWSPSRRNNPYANSGIVVPVNAGDLHASYHQYGPLAGMYFQQAVEQLAYQHGGGNFVAPAQRMTDMVNNTLSSTLPGCSYLPGINPASMKDILPEFISSALRHAFKIFGKKLKGYLTGEAVVVATESRTSSPVRIPRDNETLQHPQVKNLYPCSEGAGYAGGIVSASMDGEKVADSIVHTLRVESL